MGFRTYCFVAFKATNPSIQYDRALLLHPHDTW